MTFDYKQYLADTFEQLKDDRIENLIIDIRNNNGGADEMKDELLTYFDIDSIKENSREGRTRYTSFPESLKPFIRTWGNPWYFELEPEKTDGRYFVFKKGATINRKNDRKENAFKGNVTWLIGPANASLAYYLAKDVRKYKIGKLVGEETGGNVRGINGGQIIFLKLPNSEIELDFPVMGDFTIATKPNNGVLPDEVVEQTIEDIAEGKDTVLEWAIKDLLIDK